MEKINKSNMVLRYYIGLEDTEERVDMLFDFLKKSGIKRVVLFSAPFAETNSILPIDYYKNHAKMLMPVIEKLRKMGVEVGINSLYTMGHCLYAGEEEIGFKRAVTLDGEKSRGCVCSLQDGFLEYVKELYQTYAKLNPSVIFLDDDIRMISLGQFICVCDEHLKKISEKVGRQVTKEEVRDAVYKDSFKDNPVRDAFFNQLSEDVDFLVNYISDIIHEISPETEIGIMTTSYPTVTADRDLKEFFKKFQSKKVTRIRTGMDYYREGDYHTIPYAFSQPIIQRDFLDNPEVEIQPEIENDTYTFYMKSNIVTEMPMGEWVECDNLIFAANHIFSYTMADKKLGLTVLRSPIYGDLRISDIDLDTDYEIMEQGRKEGTVRVLFDKSKEAPLFATEFNNPPVVLCEANHEGDLSPSGSFLNYDAESVLIMVLKKAEDNGNVIIRGNEFMGKAQKLNLTAFGKEYTLDISPYEIFTAEISGGEIRKVNMLED